MYCKHPHETFQFTIRPTACCMGAAAYASPVIGFSEGAGRERVYTNTSLDSGYISQTQTIITSRVGSSTDILPGTSADVFISTLSTEMLLFQNR